MRSPRRALGSSSRSDSSRSRGEGVETTLLLWSMVQAFGDAPAALLGALLGLVAAVLLGWLLARGMVRIDLRIFFAWTGAFLVIVAAGVFAYAIHDLQEAGALPGPFTAAAPIDAVTGCRRRRLGGLPVRVGIRRDRGDPAGSPLAAILQATVGFMPKMSWLQVIAWAGVHAHRRDGLRARSPAFAPTREAVQSSSVPNPRSLSRQGA